MKNFRLPCPLFFMGVIVFSLPAMATVYHCETEQALKWEHGKLVPDMPNRHTVFEYHDKNEGLLANMLSIAKAPGLPAGFFKQQVIQEMGTGNDLVISSNQVRFSEGQTFRLRAWDKSTNGMAFLYTWNGLIRSGHCDEKI